VFRVVRFWNLIIKELKTSVPNYRVLGVTEIEDSQGYYAVVAGNNETTTCGYGRATGRGTAVCKNPAKGFYRECPERIGFGPRTQSVFFCIAPICSCIATERTETDMKRRIVPRRMTCQDSVFRLKPHASSTV